MAVFYFDMVFNMQHVGLLMTTSGKSIIWLGGMNDLNLPVLPVSSLCPAMRGSQGFSTAPTAQTVELYFQISYLMRLKK